MVLFQLYAGRTGRQGTSMTQTADCYGVHWTDGIAWLHQGGEPTTLADKPAQQVQGIAREDRCNHAIPVHAVSAAQPHREMLSTVWKDLMFQAMLPVPKTGPGIWYFDVELLYPTLLCKLSSPVFAPIRAMANMTLEQIIDAMGQSNVQPLLLTGVRDRHAQLVERLVAAAPALPRTLILIGKAEMPLSHSFSMLPDLPLQNLILPPWEQLGANILRDYMLGRLTSEGGAGYGASESSSAAT